MKNDKKEDKLVNFKYNNMIHISLHKREAYDHTIADLCSYNFLSVRVSTYQYNLNNNKVCGPILIFE